MRRMLALSAVLLCLSPGPALAQGILLDAGVATGGNRDQSIYRVGYFGRLGGAFEGQVHGLLVRALEGGDARRWGAGIEIAAWRGGSAGPYLAGSLDGGLTTRDAQDFWGSWSAGMGYELQPAGFVSVNAEARWRQVSGTGRGGLQFGLGLGFRWGQASTGRRRPATSAPAYLPPAPPPAGPSEPTGAPAAADQPPPLSTSATSDRAQLLASIITTARQEMGRRYQYGGQGGDRGFDCSALIQYAYGVHGIALPRTSGEQAAQGTTVERSLAALAPGDLLLFANSGRVSHVGMYVGEGRFIHSASSGGVQESVLSPDDPYGAWWYRRWVGGRRIVP